MSSWELPFAKWFVGGTLNVSVNCLDRHVDAGRGDQVAFHWEGEPGDTRTITYADLLDEAQRFANVLKSLGVAAGRPGRHLHADDPRAAGGDAGLRPHRRAALGRLRRVLAPTALRDRINDAEAKVLITADGGFRRGAAGALKPNADAAVEGTPTIEHVVVVRRTGGDVTMHEGRDHWYHELMVEAADPVCEPERMASEDLLYLLYTSGTTG